MKRTVEKGHTIASICNFIGISRQAYHKRLSTKKSKNGLYNSLEKVVIKNRKIKSRAGLRVIYYKENLSSFLGVNQFEKQMSHRGYSLKPYRSFIKTTDSRGLHYIFDNLIEGMKVTQENQVIVGDITYYQSNTSLYYIFQFTDFYTLEIKGLIGGRTMEGLNAEKCLRQVFKYNNKNKYNGKLIIHTDAGGQYRSHKFQDMLKKAGIRPSHARNCFENGLAERINGILKNEYLVDYDIRSENQLKNILVKIKNDANNLWPSKTLNYKTPKTYADWTRNMEKQIRPIKIVKIVQGK